MEIDIHTLIGEATAYDKKQMLEVRRPKSWLKSVSAFANGEGGTLIFGISDDDKVLGLADAEGDAEKDPDMRPGTKANRALPPYRNTSTDNKRICENTDISR